MDALLCHLMIDKYTKAFVRAGVCDVVHQAIAPFFFFVDDSLQEDQKSDDGGLQMHATVSFVQQTETR